MSITNKNLPLTSGKLREFRESVEFDLDPSISRALAVLEELDGSVKHVGFPSKDDLDHLTEDWRKVLEIARNAFTLQFPLSSMRVSLSRGREQIMEEPALREMLEPNVVGMFYDFATPLIAFAERWIKEIDNWNGNAILRVNLTPSLQTDKGEWEEKLDYADSAQAERKLVRLPISVLNSGSGRAFDVKVQILDEQEHVRGVVPLDSIDPDEVKIAPFEFWQTREERISLKIRVVYSDFYKAENDEPFDGKLEWPPLVILGQGPLVNPYIVGRPVGKNSEIGTLFIGRDDQLLRLRAAVIRKNQNAFVCGLRRTGKTSLILQLREELRNQSIVFVYVDCLHLELTEENWALEKFLSAVANAILAEVPESTGLADRNLNSARFSSICKEVFAQTRKRIVIVFDEADAFTRPRLVKIREAILSLLKDAVLDNVLSILVHEFVDDYWEQPYRDFPAESIEVGLLNRSQMEALATNPVPALNFTPLALSYLWLVTGGYPFLTQLVCHHLIEKLNSRIDPHTKLLNTVVHISDLKEVIEYIILNEDDHIQIDYLEWSFRDDEKALLLELAKPDPDRSQDVNAQTGEVKPVKVETRDGVRIRLRGREECGNDEHTRFVEKYAGKEDIFGRLLSKQVFDRYDESGSRQSSSANLRLRIGLLWLYLQRRQESK